ncbi:MAG TPA: hypothetical protein VN253_08530 [Kofleriaceae bacterium]|nr:hypothetical protein [Kofleriaceae bacterium]
MSKLTLSLNGPGAGTFVAQMVARPDGGSPTRETLRLELGHPREVAVEPGSILVEVCLPSGEILRDERTIAAGRDETIAFNLPQARREWLGWRQVLTGQAPGHGGTGHVHDAHDDDDDDHDDAHDDDAPGHHGHHHHGEHGERGPYPGPFLVREIRVHRPGSPAPIVVAVNRTGVDGVVSHAVQDGGATYQLHTDEKTMSLTIEGYRGPWPLVEMIMSDGRREVAVPPLPWYDAQAQPVPVQLIFDCDDVVGRAEVIVHDPVFSPVLAYYAAGNRAAARELSPEIERRAVDAIRDKVRNPCVATAGLLVLRRTRGAALDDVLFENLARIKYTADGPILHAQRLLEAKDRRRELDRVRAALLEAVRRGPPIFAQCGRSLRDGLRRVAAAEQEQNGVATPEIAAALEWATALVDASRSDTIITWLSADDATLARIVPGVVLPPT